MLDCELVAIKHLDKCRKSYLKKMIVGMIIKFDEWLGAFMQHSIQEAFVSHLISMKALFTDIDFLSMAVLPKT